MHNLLCYSGTITYTCMAHRKRRLQKQMNTTAETANLLTFFCHACHAKSNNRGIDDLDSFIDVESVFQHRMNLGDQHRRTFHFWYQRHNRPSLKRITNLEYLLSSTSNKANNIRQRLIHFDMQVALPNKQITGNSGHQSKETCKCCEKNEPIRQLSVSNQITERMRHLQALLQKRLH